MVEKYSITKKEEVYNLLKNKRNFEFMSEPLLRNLIDIMKVIRFREETLLIKQGSENAYFYIIIKGSVSVYVDGKFLYNLRRTGDVFGEISFVTQSRSTASIKAEKDLGVIAVSYSLFNDLKNVELALWLARVIGEKLVRTSKLKSNPPSNEIKNEEDQSQVEIPDLLTDVNDAERAEDNNETDEESDATELSDSETKPAVDEEYTEDLNDEDSDPPDNSEVSEKEASAKSAQSE